MSTGEYRYQFIRAYIECALWSSTDFDGEPLDGLYTVADIDDAALETMYEDCREFISYDFDVLGSLPSRTYGAGQAGHDFWLTRNGHGAGFWDRGLGDIGDVLTKHAKAYGSQDLYVGDDGFLYVS